MKNPNYDPQLLEKARYRNLRENVLAEDIGAENFKILNEEELKICTPVFDQCRRLFYVKPYQNSEAEQKTYDIIELSSTALPEQSVVYKQVQENPSTDKDWHRVVGSEEKQYFTEFLNSNWISLADRVSIQHRRAVENWHKQEERRERREERRQQRREERRQHREQKHQERSHSAKQEPKFEFFIGVEPKQYRPPEQPKPNRGVVGTVADVALYAGTSAVYIVGRIIYEIYIKKNND